jgi:hypothetical protein
MATLLAQPLWRRATLPFHTAIGCHRLPSLKDAPCNIAALAVINTQAGPPCHVRVTHIGTWALKNRPFPTIFGHLTHIWPTLVGMLARLGHNASPSGCSWSRKKHYYR